MGMDLRYVDMKEEFLFGEWIINYYLMAGFDYY